MELATCDPVQVRPPFSSTPDHRQDELARICRCWRVGTEHQRREKAFAARSAIALPIARDDVAAGEGAFRTWRVASASEKTKSSTSRPSRAIACARTPGNA